MLILLVMFLHVGTYARFQIKKTHIFNTVLIVCRTAVEGALLYFQFIAIATSPGLVFAGLVPLAVISCEPLLFEFFFIQLL